MPQPIECFEGTKFHWSNKCAGQASCSEAMWHRSVADRWECVISADNIYYIFPFPELHMLSVHFQYQCSLQLGLSHATTTLGTS